MNRPDAYQLLCEVLDSYRKMPATVLVALAGSRREERVTGESGDYYLLDVRVAWVDDRQQEIRITAVADTPSTFHLERLDESIVVRV